MAIRRFRDGRIELNGVELSSEIINHALWNRDENIALQIEGKEYTNSEIADLIVLLEDDARKVSFEEGGKDG